LVSELGFAGVDTRSELMDTNGTETSYNRLIELLKSIAHHLLGDTGESKCSDTLKCSRLSICFLALINALCWLSTPEDASLGELIQEPTCMLYLTDFSHHPWLISKSFHVLCVLASHTRLSSVVYVSLLKDHPTDPKRSFVVRLCARLADPMVLATEPELSERESILVLFSSLLHHTEKPDLGEHPSLLASLIILLNGLTALLWDEAEEVMDSELLSDRTVRTLFQAVLLLHGILCKGSSPGTTLLSGVFYELPKSRSEVWSSSLSHFYVVSIGRMSYAPVPHWLNSQCKAMIEASCDLAHDLMGLIIEGPEEDLIWSAFNEGENQEMIPMPIDDEEMEARAAEM